MEFTAEEKLAMVHVVIKVFTADNVLHMGEIAFMEKLKKKFDIDIPTVEKADDLDTDTALVELGKMSHSKKKILVDVVREAAIADDVLHEKEMDLILETLKSIGLGEELD